MESVDDDSEFRELSMVAADLGISQSELARQLDLQAAMDPIDYEALDPGFAEISSTPGKNFRIHYYSSRTAGATVRRAIDDAGLSEFTTYHKVPFSQDELGAAHDAFREQHPGLVADSWLDMQAGEVVVQVAEMPSWAGDVSEVRGVPVRWEVGELSQPD